MAVVHHPALNRQAEPLVSVCIANYNGAALIEDCIDSVLAQNGQRDVEIIVHDDASTDGSATLVREHYPGVELLCGSENVGYCVANNRMAAHARGRYLLLLNNDAALYPDAIDTLLDAARREGGNGILTLPQYDWETGELVDRGCLLDPFYNPIPNRDPDRSEVAYVIGACLWIPRAAWQRLGGFPDWMESIGEDLYLGCLARWQGLPVRALGASGYRHRQGASFSGRRPAATGLTSSLRRRRLSERNKTFVMVMFTPAPLLLGLLPVHMLLLLAEGLVFATARFSLRQFTEIYGHVMASLWRRRRLLFERRKQIRDSRRIGYVRFLTVFRPRLRKLGLLLRHRLPRLRS